MIPATAEYPDEAVHEVMRTSPPGVMSGFLREPLSLRDRQTPDTPEPLGNALRESLLAPAAVRPDAVLVEVPSRLS